MTESIFYKAINLNRIQPNVWTDTVACANFCEKNRPQCFQIEIKYKLKADIAKKLGIPEGAEDMFEVFVDEHGNQVIRLKDGAKTITIGKIKKLKN